MLKRILSVACGLLVVVALCGSIQASKFVGSLKVSGGAYIAIEKDRLVLVHQADGTRPSPMPMGGPTLIEAEWHISAPHLGTPGNKFLAIEQRCTGVRVFLEEKKTDSTKWVIEVSEIDYPQRKMVSGRATMREGIAGTKFRLSIFDGPNKGWYLGASEPINESTAPNATKLITREFIITQDPKKALLFDYINTRYWIR